jgi:hypothetical protein
VRRELDEEIEHCERLRRTNARLLNEGNEVRNSVTKLEAKLTDTEASAAKSIAGLKVKLAETETSAAAGSAVAEKHFDDFCSKTVRDLAVLREACECSITSLGGICSPVPGTVPSAEDYIHWLKLEVDFLPQVFAGVNENFVSVAVEGVLEMVRGGSSIDLEALWRVTTRCGMAILPGTRDTKKGYTNDYVGVVAPVRVQGSALHYFVW